VLGWLALGLPALADTPQGTGGGRPSEKVQKLIDALQSRNADVRQRAAEALGKLGEEALPAVPALIRRVGDNQFSQKGLVRAYVDGSRIAALLALKKLAPDRVKEALQKAARSRNTLVRLWAGATLKRLDP
jgi:HEAT repeat protein